MIVEILFSLPLMVKNTIRSVVKLKLCDAFPSVCFPFSGTIFAHILLNAVATILGLAVSFKLVNVGGHG